MNLICQLITYLYYYLFIYYFRIGSYRYYQIIKTVVWLRHRVILLYGLRRKNFNYQSLSATFSLIVPHCKTIWTPLTALTFKRFFIDVKPRICINIGITNFTEWFVFHTFHQFLSATENCLIAIPLMLLYDVALSPSLKIGISKLKFGWCCFYVSIPTHLNYYS